MRRANGAPTDGNAGSGLARVGLYALLAVAALTFVYPFL